VLTDGKVTLDENGRELKTLAYRDIDAVFLAQRRGVRVILVTGETSPWADRIARRLEIKYVYQGAKDKCRALQNICADLGIDLNEVSYVGDSMRDVGALAMVGLGLVPADASPAARAVAHRVLKERGGNGAVAEAVEIVLQSLEDSSVTNQPAHGCKV
jgi:3-deoxy-D-manno-octulosonate 8-phosphate phosphatase (KDO 8-P phosphatase)